MAEVNKVIRKTFCLCKFCDDIVTGENEENRENAPEHYENDKMHLG